MSIRLVVTDIDGTFFDDQHHYDVDRFNEQYQEMHRQGIHFAVASGNDLIHLHDIFEDKTPLQTFVAENGANIVDGQKPIAQSLIKPAILEPLIDRLESDPLFAGAHIHLSGKQGAYARKDDPSIHSELVRYYIPKMMAVDDLRDVSDDIYKLNLGFDQGDVMTEAQKINRLFGQHVFATPSGFGSIDVIPKGVNKAYGIDQLQQHWDLTPDEIMAFGDNFNDLEMLQHVKHGYVMKNAPEAMHQFDLPVTPLDNNASGVLDMLDRLLVGDLL
ncbi:MAG: Cof-type HAD-IIB family hydrolase [Lactobacillus sp.]|nr:Cof-type HAD-IIB family hydrolase [Lactobacillus sp.]